MAENSKIEWCDATFNHVRGCTKVSAGCAHCYADTLSKRNPLTLGVWGPNGTRVVAAESAWREPVKWNRLAAEGRLPDGSPNVDGHRPRVFCASLADVFEDWPNWMRAADGEPLYRYHSVPYPEGVSDKIAGIVYRADGWTRNCTHGGRPNDGLTMDDVRRRLFALIDATPNLDWLLVTKRPENVKRMLFECQHGGGPCSHPKCDYKPRPNLWLGASVENQAAADERIPHLLRTPAAVRFLSCEPLIGEVDLSRWLPIYRSRSASGESSGPWQRSSSWPTSGWPGWVIVGGESGFGAQPCNVAWVRSIVRQCKAAGVACFVKQLGAKPYSKPSLFTGPGDIYTLEHRDGGRVEHHLKDKKGGDIAEFPDDLKVREFPTPTGAAS